MRARPIKSKMFLILRIDGHLDQIWTDWFEGLALQHLPDGSTELSGEVMDQAAFYGLLGRALDLGLTLRSMSMETDEGSDATSETG